MIMIIMIMIIIIITLQIESCGDVSLLQQLCMENVDILIDCGFNKPISKCGLEDKVTIVQSVCLQMVVLNTLAELDQFKDGLSSLGVVRAIKEHSSLLQSFYCSASKMQLTSGTQCT